MPPLGDSANLEASGRAKCTLMRLPSHDRRVQAGSACRPCGTAQSWTSRGMSSEELQRNCEFDVGWDHVRSEVVEPGWSRQGADLTL